MELLAIEQRLVRMGAEVTGQFPDSLKAPFSLRKVESRTAKAIKGVGTLLGAMTACARQLGMIRDGAESGLFDGQTDDRTDGASEDGEDGGEGDDDPELPLAARQAVEDYVDRTQASLGKGESVTLTHLATGRSATIRGQKEARRPKEPG